MGTTGDLIAGRYRLGALLGTGGVSDVYAATDERLDRRVAVKLLRLDGTDPDARARCAGEGRLLAGLSHPHLVRVIDASEPASGAGTEAYLVLELVEGGTLARALAGGPLRAGRVRQVAVQLAGALAYLHGRGIVHRDVKPANVLLEPDGSAKLTDFGIARVIGSGGLTRAGLLVGTATYLSPEQVEGVEVGAPSDLYSLGLMLLECLTGRTEYPGPAAEAAVARLSRPPTIPADLDPGLARLLRAMTRRDPADRITAAALFDALHRPAPTAVLTRPAASAPASQVRRRRLTALAGAASVAAAGAGIGLVLTAPAAATSRPDTTPRPVVATSPPSVVALAATTNAPAAVPTTRTTAVPPAAAPPPRAAAGHGRHAAHRRH